MIRVGTHGGIYIVYACMYRSVVKSLCVHHGFHLRCLWLIYSKNTLATAAQPTNQE